MSKKLESLASGNPLLDENGILDVGVDDGFANTNVVVFAAGKLVHQLAIASRGRSGIHGTTAIGSVEENSVAAGYETEGVTFTVGDFADSESAKFDDYPFSSMNRIIVNHALRMAGLGGKKIRVATGLPISTYYHGGKTNSEAIVKKDASIRIPVRPLDSSSVAEILAHSVYPEGLAAWIDYAVNDQGELVADLDETTAVIDIGGRTTDTAVVLPGRRIDHARSGSADIGVLDVIEAIRVKLLIAHGVEVPIHAIDRALRTQSITLWGKKLDVSEVIQTATDEVIERIQREVSRRLGSGVDIDRILLVGGGAHVFRDVASRYPNVEVRPDPEFANARGFAKHLSL